MECEYYLLIMVRMKERSLFIISVIYIEIYFITNNII